MPNIRKKQTLKKLLCIYSNSLSCIIYQESVDAKKHYSMSLRGCSSWNVKIPVIGLGEFNNLFFSHFCPDTCTPGLLTKTGLNAGLQDGGGGSFWIILSKNTIKFHGFSKLSPKSPWKWNSSYQTGGSSNPTEPPLDLSLTLLSNLVWLSPRE